MMFKFFIDESKQDPDKVNWYIITAIRVEAPTQEVARAQAELQVPEGRKIWCTVNEHRFTEAELDLL